MICKLIFLSQKLPIYRSMIHSTRPGMLSIMRQVLQTEHVSGLWRGIMPSITRTVPGVGIYFSSLHWLKNHSGVSTNGKEPSAIEAVCLGMAARSLAGCIMIPITVIKTRFESGTYNYNRMSQVKSIFEIMVLNLGSRTHNV